MQTTHRKHDIPLAREPVSDRYRHIHFLSETLSETDCPVSPPSSGRPAVKPPLRRAARVAPLESESHDPEDRRFLQWVLDRSGVDPGCYHGARLARRLSACLRDFRTRSISEAWEQRLRRKPERMPEAMHAANRRDPNLSRTGRVRIPGRRSSARAVGCRITRTASWPNGSRKPRSSTTSQSRH